MPDVLADIVTLDSIYNIFLINSTSKGKNVVVFERAQGDARSGDSQRVDLLPLVFLDIIDLTEPVNLTVDERANNIDESLDSTERVVSVREDHRGLFVHIGENFIVSVTFLQILVLSLVAAPNQVDSSVFSGNRSGVKGHLELHGDGSLFKLRVVYFEDICIFLIPLE